MEERWKKPETVVFWFKQSTAIVDAALPKHENLVIANLDSGVGVVPVARVRWSDVLSITTEADEDRAQAATGCG